MPKLLLTNRKGTSAKGGPGSGPKPHGGHHHQVSVLGLGVSKKSGGVSMEAEPDNVTVKEKVRDANVAASNAHMMSKSGDSKAAALWHNRAAEYHQVLQDEHTRFADGYALGSYSEGVSPKKSKKHREASSAHQAAVKFHVAAAHVHSGVQKSLKRLIIKGGPGSGPKPHGGRSNAERFRLAQQASAQATGDAHAATRTAEGAPHSTQSDHAYSASMGASAASRKISRGPVGKADHEAIAENHRGAAKDHGAHASDCETGSKEQRAHLHAQAVHTAAANAHEQTAKWSPKKSLDDSEFTEGEAVSFLQDDVRVAGQVVKHLDTGKLSVRLAMPFDGKLCLTDSEVEVSEDALESEDFEFVAKRIQAFEDIIPFEMDAKSLVLKDEKGNVEDYRDVRIAGMASTFKEVTPKDREGDYVLKGAFNRTLKQFMQNPVMLLDHKNHTDSLVGSYTKVEVNDAGLYVEGILSNAPSAKSIRFLVAEKHLKAFSMGGFFQYGKDAKGIEGVELFEISLTPIPMNPDSLFQVRSVGVADAVKCWKGHQKTFKHGGK